MFAGILSKGRGLSQAQRRVLPLLTSRSTTKSSGRREAKLMLEKANRKAVSRGFPAAILQEDAERESLHREFAHLMTVQKQSIAQDRERYAAIHHRRTGENIFETDNTGPSTAMASASPKETGRRRGYDQLNERTGNSAVQEWFDELVHRSILKHCPPSKDDLRLSELLKCIRAEMPSFSFRDHCDGVPFSLLIKNCCYLQSFGGKVCFLPVRREDYCGDDADESFDTTESPAGFVHDDTIVGLRKYKLREVASQDGVRQGPQPWLYSGGMLPCSRPKRHRRSMR